MDTMEEWKYHQFTDERKHFGVCSFNEEACRTRIGVGCNNTSDKQPSYPTYRHTLCVLGNLTPLTTFSGLNVLVKKTQQPW